MYGDIGDELAELTKAVQESNRANTPWRSFVHGVLVGLGSTIGAAIAIAVAIFLLRNLIEIPYLGPIGRLLPKLEQALEQSSQGQSLPDR